MEISYCNFYRECTERQKEPNFNQWTFLKKEEIKPLYGWQKPQGEQWTKTNGRVRATIQYDRSGIMVKLTLSYKNDSPTLEFIENVKDVVAHASKESSINAKVVDLKKTAEAFMGVHLLPRYERIMLELRDIEQMLCIE